MISVLYVDDERSLLDIGKAFLEMTGDFTVELQESARSALSLLERRTFDAIISDYQMPEMDGISFLKEVRRKNAEIPFILFTGRGREEVVIAAINNGADFYLQKGGDPTAQFAELAHKIRQAVARHKAQDDLRAAYQRISVSEEELRRRLDEVVAATRERDLTEMNFHALVDNAPDAIFIETGDIYRYVNNAMLRLVRAASADQLIGTPTFDRIHPSFHDNIRARVMDLTISLKPVKLQDEIYVRLDGSPVDVEVAAMPFLYKGEHGALVMVRDITERKHAETELRAAYEQIAAAEEELRGQYDELAKSEQRYRRLTEKVPIPVCVANYDDVIIYLNEKFTALFGYTYEDIPTLKEWWERAYPDENYRREVVSSWTHAVDEALEKGRDVQPMTFRVTCKDTTFRYVEIAGISFESSFLATFIDMTGRVMALEELQRSEESYRNLFNTVGQAIYIQDTDWKFIDVNKGAEALYGYSREEFIGQTPAFLSAPGKNDMAAVELHMQKALAGEPRQFEFWARTKEGRIFAKDVRVHRGTYFGRDVIIAIGIDITERKLAEQKLSEINRVFLSFTPDPAANIRILLGLAGGMLNAASVHYARCEDSTCVPVESWQNAPGVPSCEAAGLHIAQETLAGEAGAAVIISDICSAGCTGVLPKDMVPPGIRTVVALPFCIRDTRGGCLCLFFAESSEPTKLDLEILAFIAKAVAIEEERRIASLALQESEQRFRLLLQNMPSIAVQGYNLDGTTQYWNRASEKLYGYSAGEAMGRNILDLIIPPEIMDEVKESIEKMGDTGNPIPAAEVTLMRKDGSRVETFSHHALVKNPKHGPEFFCIDIDLTERKRMETALRQAYKKLGLLASITRHDMNNQLTTLVLNLHLLEEKLQDPVLAGYIQRADEATRQIAAMIEFSKEYEAIGMTAPVWQKTNSLVEQAQNQIKPGSVRIQNDLPEDVEVFADPLIVRVFYNLMDNALRYGKKITCIRFSGEEQGGVYLIICEDDGEGIPDNEKGRIFERGYGRNTGLGLALSQEILGITGITIHEKGTYGEGARFELHIPKSAYRLADNRMMR